jgi:hypothetical protein
MPLPGPVGVLEAWESEPTYPAETPFVSEIRWLSGSESYQGPQWLRGIAVADMTPITIALSVVGLGGVGKSWSWKVGQVGFSTDPFGSRWPAIEQTATVQVVEGSTPFSVTRGLTSNSLAVPTMGQPVSALTAYWTEADELLRLIRASVSKPWPSREVLWEPFAFQENDVRRTEAMTALGDLMRWLSLNQAEVADVCQFSLRASRYWGGASPKSPRPTTVRRLHEVHAFVGSLVRAMGRDRARAWLDQSSAGGTRLDRMAAEGVTNLVREASGILFAAPPRPDYPRSARMEAEEEEAMAQPYEPIQQLRPPRRPRTSPQRGE